MPQRAPAPGQPLRLRVLVDRSSPAVFVGDGEVMLTEQVFPAVGDRRLRLYAQGGTAVFGATTAWPLAGAHQMTQTCTEAGDRAPRVGVGMRP